MFLDFVHDEFSILPSPAPRKLGLDWATIFCHFVAGRFFIIFLNTLPKFVLNQDFVQNER